jgi:CheY-like chemotaxis protein
MTMHVLVVDDDPWCRRIAERVLARRGHQVTTAATLGEARARVRLDADAEAVAGAFDLVLLDINLPGGSSELLLHELRELGAALPIVAVTASAMAGDRERFLRQGFTAYVSKPIDVRTFGEVVERLASERPCPGGDR